MTENTKLKLIEEKNLNETFVTHIANIEEHFKNNLENLTIKNDTFDYLKNKVKPNSYNKLFDMVDDDEHLYVLTV